MKKILLVSAVLIFFSLAPHVFAQGFVPLAEIEGLTKGVAADTAGLAAFFNNLYKFAIGMATVLAVIMIIWGGIEYSWQDIPGAKSNGKDRILQAILGLVLVLSPVLVFSIINPSILNLSINLKPLDTKSGTPAGTGTNSPTATTDAKTGCSVTGGEYFKTITCADQSTANNFNCGPGLSLRVLACKNTNAGTGKCLDTSATGYCTGKNITLEFYQYYRSYVGVLFGDALPIPRDAAAASTFASTCQRDGGKVSYSVTTASKAFIASHAYQASIATNGCAKDSGVVIDSSKGGGVACFNEIIACEPPS